ncbi:hypothetical protein AC629_34140 [Bradyrhizobium sp. NAS80.1]|nr:hypothetical protein AC629_34140 [Bradyrhizobium sp. NAS80.1]
MAQFARNEAALAGISQPERNIDAFGGRVDNAIIEHQVDFELGMTITKAEQNARQHDFAQAMGRRYPQCAAQGHILMHTCEGVIGSFNGELAALVEHRACICN